MAFLPDDFQNTLQQVINHHDTLYKYQLSYHLKQLAEQHFRSGPGGRVDLGSFTLSVRPTGSIVTETVIASIGVVSSLDDILSTPLRLSTGTEVLISQFTGGRDNVTLKSRQWHILSLLHERFGDHDCLPSIVSLSHLTNASIFTDDVVVSMFSELLIGAGNGYGYGTASPVTTAAIKAAAVRIRQQGASTSAATDSDIISDDPLEQLEQLQLQHAVDIQQIFTYQEEIQQLRQQLAIMQLQTMTGNININIQVMVIVILTLLINNNYILLCFQVKQVKQQEGTG